MLVCTPFLLPSEGASKDISVNNRVKKRFPLRVIDRGGDNSMSTPLIKE